MQFDVETNLAAVERTVSSLERDGQPARADEAALATSTDGRAFIAGSHRQGRLAVANNADGKYPPTKLTPTA